MRFIALLIVCPLGIVAAGFPRLVSDDSKPRRAQAAMTRSVPIAQCIPPTELDKNVLTLRSQLSEPDLSKVKGFLISNARRFPNCRSEVIQALMTAMEQASHGSGGTSRVDAEAYFLWRNGADLLAELHATEALDLLIANLGVTDGLSTSLGHYPVLDALIRIGQPSIPKLELVLSKNSEAYMRKFAVFCIASIGGAKAQSVLKNALPTESDPCVKTFIRISLEVFDNKSWPNHVPPEENGRWYSAVYCSLR